MNIEGWIDQFPKLSGRFPTMKRALELLHEREGKRIVETGTTRLVDDWGGGMSTYVFGRYADDFGAHVWTVDIKPEAIEACKFITGAQQHVITYTIGDSLDFLWGFSEPIDLLYLDSMDCPLVENPMDRELIDSQTHQLKEAIYALPKLAPNGIILLDDNGFANGGKTKLSKLYLKQNGWQEIMGAQQSLWIRI